MKFWERKLVQLVQSDMEEIPSSVFMTGERAKGQNGKKKDRKFNKKPCPIKCSKGVRANRSLYFCDTFCGKSNDERRALQKRYTLVSPACQKWEPIMNAQ